jgi:hypothetical protein
VLSDEKRGFSSPVVFPIACVVVLAHLLTASRYGIFRDELYYIACARHLGGGYVDHPPAGSLEHRRDPAIPITAVLAGKLDDRLRECIFVFSPYRTIALRTARLVGQPASPALRHPMLLLCMVCCDPPSVRA